MSSRYKEKPSKGSGSRSQYPSNWSEWQWNAEHGCEVRYRLKSPGNYEYEYRAVQAADVPRTPTTNQEPVGDYSSLDNYTASSVDAVTERFQQTSLGSVDSQPTTIDQQIPASASLWKTHIRTRDESTDAETFDPHYRVHGAWEFQWGRVFKVLWAEPNGTGSGSQSASDSQYSVRSGKFGQKAYQKVRRFVIVDPREGHCICLPIMTYTDKGVLKKGVHARDHTIIYTDKAVRFQGEKEKGLHKEPIKVKPTGPRHKLDKASRLNYAKLYTVEYNVKVWFIGKIHSESEYQLTADYNFVHPPMVSRGVPATASEPVYDYPSGAADLYQSQGSQSTYTTHAGSYPASTYPQSSSSYRERSSSYTPSDYTVATAAYSNVQVASYPATSSATYEPTYGNASSSYYPNDADNQSGTPYERESHYD